MVDWTKIIEDYFTFNGGKIHIYDNPVNLENILIYSFNELLKHDKAINGKSTAMTIKEAILGFTEVKGKTVLDVGAGIGHFSFLLAEEGAKVTAVERLDQASDVALALSILKKYNVQVGHMTIEEFLIFTERQFELTLMLNVFDHMLRENEARAWKTLRAISKISPKMVLMMGPTEQILEKARIPTKILEMTVYTETKKLLSHSYGDRDLWAFWR